MHINTGIINGMAIYYSHLLRSPPKPNCNIPNIIIDNPNIFKNPDFCTSCTCKFTCRYNQPPGHDTPKYALVPQTIKKTKYQAPILHEAVYGKIYTKELMVCDDAEKILAVKSKFEF